MTLAYSLTDFSLCVNTFRGKKLTISLGSLFHYLIAQMVKTFFPHNGQPLPTLKVPSAFPSHLEQVSSLQKVSKLWNQKDQVLFLPYHLLAM